MFDLSLLDVADGADGSEAGGVKYGAVCATSSGDSGRSSLMGGDSFWSVRSRITQFRFRDCGIWSGLWIEVEDVATRNVESCGRLLWLKRKDMRGAAGACQEC